MTAAVPSSRRLENLSYWAARRSPGRWLLRASTKLRPSPAAQRALLGFESRRLRWCQALEHARALLQLEPDDLETRTALGRILMRLGFLDDAVRAFEQVIRVEPLHAEARRQLGALYRKRERHDEARRCFEVLSADHDSPRGKVLLARALEAEGRLDLARELRLAARAQLAGRCVTPTDYRLWTAAERVLGPEGRLEAAALAALDAHPHHSYLARRWVLDLLRRPRLEGPARVRVEAWFAAHPEDRARWQLEVADRLCEGEHVEAARLLRATEPATLEQAAWSVMMHVAAPAHFAHGPVGRPLPAPRRAARRDLAAVACYFNPQHYRSRLRNFEVFHRHAVASGVRLLVVELAFGDAPFELGGLPGVLQIRGGDVLWQKERLLNLGIAALIKEGFDKVAWLDADVVFEDPDWPDAVSKVLDDVMVCQAFDRVHVRETPDDPGRYIRGIAHDFAAQRGAGLRGDGVGFAWAARAELLASVPLYDALVVGGGDRVIQIASGLSGLPAREALRQSITPRGLDHALRWARAWHARVAGRVGFVPQRIQSLPHGHRGLRRYRRRHDVLFAQDFCPETDLALDAAGCWRWASDKPELHREVAAYFAGRQEDDGA